MTKLKKICKKNVQILKNILGTAGVQGLTVLMANTTAAITDEKAVKDMVEVLKVNK